MCVPKYILFVFVTN